MRRKWLATLPFTNGTGTWDNNAGRNYSVGTGTVTITGGVVTSADPCAATPDPTGSTPAATQGEMLGGDPRKESIYFVLTARFYDGDTVNDRGGSQDIASGNAAGHGIPNGTSTDAVTGDVKSVTNGTLTASVSAQGDLRVYVLALPGNPAPGKVGTDGPYLR